MRIQHNIMAMSAYRNYTNNVAAMKKNLEKLSSGYKINRAGDDAAGLAISEKMRAQITGLETAQKNAKDGISLVQTAEGALTEVHDMLNRMVELATQSANGTYDNTTDRNQMQKEVDQLLKEIDRIADSSNFNGINLLDGTLGMNTDAFTVGASNGFEQGDPDVTQALEIASYHGGKAVTAQAPSFEIDLDSLKLKNETGAAIATGATFATITIGSTDYSLTAAAAIATDASITASTVAAALAKAFNTGSLGAAANSVGSFAGAGFKASAAGNKVTFTYQGKLTTGAVASGDIDTAATAMTSAVASAINAALGGTVTIAGATDVTANGSKELICDITAPKNAVVAKPADRPGADIDLADVIEDGYTIDIDGKKYTFKVNASASVTAAPGAQLIDVSGVATADKKNMAAMIVAGGLGSTPGNAGGSAQTTTNFKISYKGGTTIHVDALDDKRADFDTASKVQAKINYTEPGTADKAASTELVVDPTKIKGGNVLKIGSDVITFASTDNTATKVQAKIEEAGYTVEAAAGTGSNAGKTVMKIYAKTSSTVAAKDTTAPMILGKGLTLQIGDTSDDFNQLNVAVQDMHAASIGVGGLRIDTEEAAQAAIDKIKSAINTVSDVRGTLGATQNRLDHTINNLSVMTENIQDAESTIRDVDVAEEMMAYTKNNILIQSAQAMLAQANQVPQGVLQLLQ